MEKCLGKPCEGFLIEDPAEAFTHMSRYERIEFYGDCCAGHNLHVFDDGSRSLGRCKRCGGYMLVQRSEFHGYDDDDYFTDYIPVSGPEEATAINEKYSGEDIETSFPKPFLGVSNGRPDWLFQPLATKKDS